MRKGRLVLINLAQVSRISSGFSLGFSPDKFPLDYFPLDASVTINIDTVSSSRKSVDGISNTTSGVKSPLIPTPVVFRKIVHSYPTAQMQKTSVQMFNV